MVSVALISSLHTWHRPRGAVAWDAWCVSVCVRGRYVRGVCQECIDGMPELLRVGIVSAPAVNTGNTPGFGPVVRWELLRWIMLNSSWPPRRKCTCAKIHASGSI